MKVGKNHVPKSTVVLIFFSLEISPATFFASGVGPIYKEL